MVLSIYLSMLTLYIFGTQGPDGPPGHKGANGDAGNPVSVHDQSDFSV